MKNLLKLTLLLISLNVGSQVKKELELIIPLKTYHLDRTNIDMYANGEGGNIGAIFNYTINKGNALNTNYIAGVFRNSFGDFSTTLQYGRSASLKRFKLVFAIGFATGYKKAYRNTYYSNGEKKYHSSDILLKKLSKLEKHGILPVYNISLSYMTKYNVGLVLNVNHEYINSGIVINLSSLIK